MIAMSWAALWRLLVLMFVLGVILALWLVARGDHTTVAGDPPVAAICPAKPPTVV